MADNYTTEEGSHTLADGHKVYTKTWKPTTPPKALLLLIHGFSDHINSYYTLFPTLASHGIQSHGFDQRGWGRTVHSPAEKGLTGPTETVLDDITQILRTQIPIAESLNNIPLFLMGHSMGGAQVLQYAARGPADVRAHIRGYLAESPFVALHPSAQPSKFIEVAGKMAAKILPRRQMVQHLEPKWICRDEQVCKEYVEDKLCHDTGTLEGLAGMLQRASELDSGVVMPSEGRYWVGHGDQDHITSYDCSRKLFERLGEKVTDKEFRTYEGHYHKLHAEPGEDKIVFANDVAKWILARSGEVDEHVGASKL